MKEVIAKILPEIIRIRRSIHAHPELANEEERTSGLVFETLKQFGYEDLSRIGTGVVATLDSGRPGKTVALRADMDALPIQEENDVPHRSQTKGKMHACGHDGHTATLLAVAFALRQIKESFAGKVRLLFQPAEETGHGASALIASGSIEDVDAIFGYHNTPHAKKGKVQAKTGCILAGQQTFFIRLRGKGGHVSQALTTCNPIAMGARIIQKIQAFVDACFEPVIVSVTEFHAGTTHNIIPEEAHLQGSIRTLSSEKQKEVCRALQAILKEETQGPNARGEISFPLHFPPTWNHPEETAFVQKTAVKIVGENNVETLKKPSMASEDFSRYLEKIPGCFFFIGNGKKNGELHTPTYEFNDAVIPIAAEVMGSVALDFLRGGVKR